MKQDKESAPATVNAGTGKRGERLVFIVKKKNLGPKSCCVHMLAEVKWDHSQQQTGANFFAWVPNPPPRCLIICNEELKQGLNWWQRPTMRSSWWSYVTGCGPIPFQGSKGLTRRSSENSAVASCLGLERSSSYYLSGLGIWLWNIWLRFSPGHP